MQMTTKTLDEIRRRNAEGENDIIIAEALGCKHKLVHTYRQAMGLPSHGNRRRGSMIYTVWDAKTDELLACGDAKLVAERLGLVNNMAVHQMVSRVLKGNSKKYIVEKVRRVDSEECIR